MTTMANGLAVAPGTLTPPVQRPDTTLKLAEERPDPAAVRDTPAPHKRPSTRSVAPFLSREQILDATLECLLADGYDGTTIRRIARQLNCAVGSIYRYFKDKRELLDAVTQRRFVAVAEWIEGGATMREGFGAYAQVAGEQPELYRLMFWLQSVGSQQPEMPAIIDRIIDGWAAQVSDRRTAERLWSHLHGGIILGRGADHVMDLEPPRPEAETGERLEPVILRKKPALIKPPVTQELRDDVTLL